MILQKTQLASEAILYSNRQVGRRMVGEFKAHHGSHDQVRALPRAAVMPPVYFSPSMLDNRGSGSNDTASSHPRGPAFVSDLAPSTCFSLVQFKGIAFTADRSHAPISRS